MRTTRVVPKPRIYHGLAPLMSFGDAISATKPDLIVSGDDLATRHLHHLYQRESKRGRSGRPICELIERSLGAPESFGIVYARTAFIQLAREQGIRAPETEVIGSIADLKRRIARTGLPVVLKTDGTSGGDGVRVVHTTEEAECAFDALQAPPLFARAAKRALVDKDKTFLRPSLFRHHAVVNAQAFVAGREATSTLACWKGEVLASLHCEVVHKTDAAGPATVMRLIESADMSDAAERMVRCLKLSGVHGLDFMLETETAKAHLIEINPRATQVGHLKLGVDHDLPAALYSALSGKPIQPAAKVTENAMIALFPQEWMRDPCSPLLQSAHHDVPWEEPDLIRACIEKRAKRVPWTSRAPASTTNFSTMHDRAAEPVQVSPLSVGRSESRYE
jgi:hypothetical protein